MVWILDPSNTFSVMFAKRLEFLQVIEAQPDMPVVGAVSLHVALLTFVLRVHVDRVDYVDQVLVCPKLETLDFPCLLCYLYVIPAIPRLLEVGISNERVILSVT